MCIGVVPEELEHIQLQLAENYVRRAASQLLEGDVGNVVHSVFHRDQEGREEQCMSRRTPGECHAEVRSKPLQEVKRWEGAVGRDVGTVVQHSGDELVQRELTTTVGAVEAVNDEFGAEMRDADALGVCVEVGIPVEAVHQVKKSV